MWVAMSRGTAVGVLAATFASGGAAGWLLRGGPTTVEAPTLTALPPGSMPPNRDVGRDTGREPARATVPPLAHQGTGRVGPAGGVQVKAVPTPGPLRAPERQRDVERGRAACLRVHEAPAGPARGEPAPRPEAPAARHARVRARGDRGRAARAAAAPAFGAAADEDAGPEARGGAAKASPTPTPATGAPSPTSTSAAAVNAARRRLRRRRPRKRSRAGPAPSGRMGPWAAPSSWTRTTRSSGLSSDPPRNADAVRRSVVLRAQSALRATGLADARAHLVFDTGGAGRTLAGTHGREGAITWSYARRSADEEIVRLVRHHDGRDADGPMTVITDDRELRGRAVQLGARVVRVHDWFDARPAAPPAATGPPCAWAAAHAGRLRDDRRADRPLAHRPRRGVNA